MIRNILFLFVLSIQSDDRVKIDVYGETLCPDTIRFIMRSFKKAIYTQDIEKIADINFYNYGKASHHFNEDI